MLTPLTGEDPFSVGRYRLQNRIGEGGMGTVYLAFAENRRPVALKVASAELAEDLEFRRRFQREVRAAQRVRSGAVAAVLDADTGCERPWMVTEYIEGISLADAVRQRGPLAERLVRGFAAGLADALVAIHEAGVVHRDLKPSNILLTWDGPKVIDFGIAQLDGNASLTRSGHVVGTLAWMAPEQMRGEPAGPPADVFSWGCCVAYAATARHPFHADRADALAFRIQHEAPDLAHLPGYLADAVAAALEKTPRLRPSAVGLLATLSGRVVRSMSEAHRATETVLEREWTGPLLRVAGGPERSGRLPAVPERSGPLPASPAPVYQARALPVGEPWTDEHQGDVRSLGERRPGAQPAPPWAPTPAAPDRYPSRAADWRSAQADSLRVPPPAETYRPAPAETYRPAPPAESARPALPAGSVSAAPPAGSGPPNGSGPLVSKAGYQPAAWQPPVRAEQPGAGTGEAPEVTGDALGGEPRWNLVGLVAAVFSVCWLLGFGSVAGLYLGYRARSAARAEARRGDSLAAVGIVLGWSGLMVAVVLLGIVAGRG